MSPHVSSHSVPLLDDDFVVLFSPELTDRGLIPDVENSIYFQAVSNPADKEAKVNHVEFEKAELMEGDRVIQEVTHIHNGRAVAKFTPSHGKLYQVRVKRGDSDSTKTFRMPDVLSSLEASVKLLNGPVLTSTQSFDFEIQTNQFFFASKGNNIQVSLSNKHRLITDTNLTVVNLGEQTVRG